ncbi:MAG: DUF2304 domain-containing protein [Erysipelotrichaceae bacterium]|nr:DUF2304 domain-containing protein [Erysipelotrichaceae bacterium]
MNNIYFILISIIVLLYVVNVVRKKQFSIKESFWWVLSAIVMLLLSIFPYSIDWFAKKLNISYPPSLLFVICIIFLLFINFRNSRKISELQMKVVELGQELAIVKEKVKNDKE